MKINAKGVYYKELNEQVRAAILAGDADTSGPSWWLLEPDVGRVANGVAARVDRLKAIGNGQVPAVAATAWRLLNHY